MDLVKIKNLCIKFGGIKALDDVSFDIGEGEILGLIGPNGAGKTTLFNCLTRLYVPSSGDIYLNGVSLLSMPVHHLPKSGISRTFQNLALFLEQSVLDNVKIGAHTRTNGDPLSDMIGLPRSHRREKEINEISWRLIEDLELSKYAYRTVSELSFGVQKRIELARALAVQPRLLLLDEPAGGLNHGDVDELGDLIRKLSKKMGLTVLLVEHHMGLVMSLADRVVVLNFGKKIAEGTPEEVQKNDDVIAAYLGRGSQPEAV